MRVRVHSWWIEWCKVEEYRKLGLRIHRSIKAPLSTWCFSNTRSNKNSLPHFFESVNNVLKMTLHFHKIELRKQYTLIMPVLRKMSQHQQQLSQMTDIYTGRNITSQNIWSIVRIRWYLCFLIQICSSAILISPHNITQRTKIHVTGLKQTWYMYHFNNLIRHWCFNSEN